MGVRDMRIPWSKDLKGYLKLVSLKQKATQSSNQPLNYKRLKEATALRATPANHVVCYDPAYNIDQSHEAENAILPQPVRGSSA